MANYTYDESGVTFYFFALTILSVILLPSTIYLFTSSADPQKKSKSNTLKLRTRKSESKSKVPLVKYSLLAFGWVLLSLIAYQVKNTDIKTGPIWDPYQILNVDTGADLGQIKRTFKKLSLKFHPDKVKAEDRENAEAKYIEITKAYKTLTDDEARENYAKYGNPDGLISRTMGIALPKLLVEAHASPFVMSLYGLIIGFLLPFYVGRWWYNSSRYTKDGILNPTMITFFKNIREPISQLNLIDLLCAAEEFNSADLAFKESERSDLVEIEKKVQVANQTYALEAFVRSEKFNSDSAWKAKVLLYAHFLRIEIENQHLSIQQQSIVEKSIHLVHRGLIQISGVHGWSGCTLLLTSITQMLTHNLYGIHQIRRLSAEDKKDKLSILGENANEVISIIDSYPQVEITKAVISVIGDSSITPYSIVTLIVKLKIINASPKHKSQDSSIKKVSEIFDNLDETDIDSIEQVFNTISKDKKNTAEPPEVVAPYLAARKLSNWWFVFSNPLNSRNVVPPVLISDLVTEKIFSVQFQAPSAPGKFDFYINIVSDSYIGCDVQQHIKMVVVDPSTLPPVSDFDDDISEPEESSFAAQMAEARGQAGAKGHKNPNDSSDED
ncbi:Translocation protein sec63 [Smittium culicis]|uniref:Translocation protein sec63 n=1 Tax=Smittium culicis TaxID=133412 RepID=A0A1R1XLP9_9FUNG|nr:Translocation protein sec63 [Smittium culicis]